MGGLLHLVQRGGDWAHVGLRTTSRMVSTSLASRWSRVLGILASSNLRRLLTKVLSRVNRAAKSPPTRPSSSAGASVARCIWIGCTAWTTTAPTDDVSQPDNRRRQPLALWAKSGILSTSFASQEPSTCSCITAKKLFLILCLSFYFAILPLKGLNMSSALNDK